MGSSDANMGPGVASCDTVCVTGASGFIGSWLIMRLLERGYTVRATVRQTNDEVKTKHLVDLAGAKERLTIWKADLDEEGSFDAVVDGCSHVFHCAMRLDFESPDPENEIINPTVEGVLNVMRSCAKATSVKRVIYTSSAGAVNFTEDFDTPGKVMDESCWTDVDFCRNLKITGWPYFVSKTLAEKAAWEFAARNKLELITVIPTLVVGPFMSNTMPPSLITALALLTGNETHCMILRKIQLVHLDDVCRALIFLKERPEAEGRYICSSEDVTIYGLAKFLSKRYPRFVLPSKYLEEPGEEDLRTVPFSSKKLKGMGFEYSYSIEDMYDGAIDTCVHKGFLSTPLLN